MVSIRIQRACNIRSITIIQVRGHGVPNGRCSGRDRYSHVLGLREPETAREHSRRNLDMTILVNPLSNPSIDHLVANFSA